MLSKRGGFMPVTLPIEVYEVFEKGFGKEDAKKVVKFLEAVIGDEVINKWHQTKEELKNELLKEVATKAELENVRLEVLGRIDALYEKTEKDKAELLGRIDKDKAELLGIMKQDKAELLGKIEIEITRLDRKFTIMFVILFFTIIFLNQNALEFLAKVLGLVR
jgi:hypothetical protein